VEVFLHAPIIFSPPADAELSGMDDNQQRTRDGTPLTRDSCDGAAVLAVQRLLLFFLMSSAFMAYLAV
jgi:hypothetical protein